MKCIVIGQGIYGLGMTYALAKRGVDVLNMDITTPMQGSSHGDSRLYRESIAEGEHLLPFPLITKRILGEINNTYINSGYLFATNDSTTVDTHNVESYFEKSIEFAEKKSIPYSILNSSELSESYPYMQYTKDDHGYFEKSALFLDPELIAKDLIDAMNSMNVTFINTLHPQETTSIIADKKYGDYEADYVFVCTGPWITEHVEYMNKYVRIFPQVNYFYTIKNSDVSIFLREYSHSDISSVVYGFIKNNILKIGMENREYCFKSYTELMNQTNDVTTMFENQKNIIDSIVKNNMVGVGDFLTQSECNYTSTVDTNFIVDFLPEDSQVAIISACSGHGFKHALGITDEFAKYIITKDPTSEQLLEPFGFKHASSYEKN